MSDHAQSVGVNVVSRSFVICFSVPPRIEVVCVMATIYKRQCFLCYPAVRVLCFYLF